jgi:uncharacterized protein (UPF0335 family)
MLREKKKAKAKKNEREALYALYEIPLSHFPKF